LYDLGGFLGFSNVDQVDAFLLSLISHKQIPFLSVLFVVFFKCTYQKKKKKKKTYQKKNLSCFLNVYVLHCHVIAGKSSTMAD
jgi:uncharacterized membrane protein YfcA